MNAVRVDARVGWLAGGPFCEVSVSAADGSAQTITAKNILLATGSEPATLPGVDADEEVIVTSTGALSLKEVPKRMVVIGGGVIGLELGSVWGRLGSEITVIEFAKDICPPMDGQIRKAFQRALKKQGMNFMMEKKVTAAVKTPSGVKLTVEPSAGGDAVEVEADVVLVATGRRPYTSGLGLDAAGVEVNKKGQVVVDMHTYATNKPGVYAIGDIVEGPMLAHKAEEEGISCVEQLAGKAGHVNYDVIPSIIYTHPEVAWCGKTEEEVKASGAEYNVGTFPFAANSRARTNDDSEGLVKFVSCKNTDKILGAHIMARRRGPGRPEHPRTASRARVSNGNRNPRNRPLATLRRVAFRASRASSSRAPRRSPNQLIARPSMNETRRVPTPRAPTRASSWVSACWRWSTARPPRTSPARVMDTRPSPRRSRRRRSPPVASPSTFDQPPPGARVFRTGPRRHGAAS